jgi:uncharacterized protein YutE (UPF0331/DUF86 family)
MLDDVLLNKAAIIERCVARAKEEYANSNDFAHDFTRQDAAILNIQRACEAAIDMGQHLVFRERLGIPQGAKDVFTLLAQAGWISHAQAEVLKKMVGFRNIAVHEYQSLLLPVVINIIDHHLSDFLDYSAAIIKKSD